MKLPQVRHFAKKDTAHPYWMSGFAFSSYYRRRIFSSQRGERQCEERSVLDVREHRALTFNKAAG